ncbi:3-phosphoshikimate 1-carboxyvinyltransferase [Myroides sp. LJL116]
MNIVLHQSKIKNNQTITISGSKSESNRLLILQELFPNLVLHNLSDSDDVKAMQSALSSNASTIDIHHAGTTMRFLTAYYSLCTTKRLVLTGSERMQQRPIGILVDALRQLDANITYTKNQGYPPLEIQGILSQGGKISLPADISSQYISALLLIGTKLKNGIQLELIGQITSLPYIQMTLSLLESLGVQTSFEGNTIKVSPLLDNPVLDFTVEPDWSSASYFYSIIALSEIGTSITLNNYKKQSLQGDSEIVSLYQELGVETVFIQDKGIVLTKINKGTDYFKADLIQTPDLAQTIAVSCFAMGIGCKLNGLHTLKIKETDRLVALQNELSKLGADIQITSDSLCIAPSSTIIANVAIDTYQDHRMAMAFAPLALKCPIQINESEVVSKSFINFWEILLTLGFQMDKQDAL